MLLAWASRLPEVSNAEIFKNVLEEQDHPQSSARRHQHRAPPQAGLEGLRSLGMPSKPGPGRSASEDIDADCHSTSHGDSPAWIVFCNAGISVIHTKRT